MPKKILSVLSVMVIVFNLFIVSSLNVRAEEKASIQSDGSFLIDADSSTGYTNGTALLRGEHLMDGECSITKAGRGKIYVYASTTADHTVDYISTVIYVDRYNKETGKWGQIDFWQAEDTNTYYVATSKLLSVDSGYYYRVHADHVAGMKSDPAYEEATSLTDGILID